MSYSVEVCGKWILAGEHAVLRGCPALVFPLSSRTLSLGFAKDSDTNAGRLAVDFSGAHGPELEVLFRAVINKACESLGLSPVALKGVMSIQSNIPIGAGLGASAALCVAIARWLHHLGYVPETELYDFSRSLENLFHGESSGVDIAVALSGEALHFERQGERQKFSPRWRPHWYLSYTGKRGVTLDCVQKVKNLIEKDPQLGLRTDQQMREAVLKAEEALQAEPMKGLQLLAEAIHQAHDCFQNWGLISEPVQAHMDFLKAQGALAVKPTGSGDGGYVLSLWSQVAPSEMGLISC